MKPYDTDIMQAIKWEYNKAPNLLSLFEQKKNWYEKYHEKFWDDWYSDVFNLATAKPFGLMVWCIILGVPSSLFGFYTNIQAWAYGPNRQNFKFVPVSDYETTGIPGIIDPTNAVSKKNVTNVQIDNPNTIGGNFVGGGETTIIPAKEVRQLLQLRYAALTTDCRVANINRMLSWIFNGGEPWGASDAYFYLADDTIIQDSNTAAMTKSHHFEYRMGPGLELSAQTMVLLNDPQYGFMPVASGCSYEVVKE